MFSVVKPCVIILTVVALWLVALGSWLLALFCKNICLKLVPILSWGHWANYITSCIHSGLLLQLGW